MTEAAGISVYIVDDDPSVRKALIRLIRSAGMDVDGFSSGREFLDSKSKYRTENACLVADIRMPGLSGLDLQRELLAAGANIPVIFITAFDCRETREEARKLGAAGYFRKPVDEQALLDAVHWAMGLAGP